MDYKESAIKGPTNHWKCITHPGKWWIIDHYVKKDIKNHAWTIILKCSSDKQNQTPHSTLAYVHAGCKYLL